MRALAYHIIIKYAGGIRITESINEITPIIKTGM